MPKNTPLMSRLTSSFVRLEDLNLETSQRYRVVSIVLFIFAGITCFNGVAAIDGNLLYGMMVVAVGFLFGYLASCYFGITAMPKALYMTWLLSDSATGTSGYQPFPDGKRLVDTVITEEDLSLTVGEILAVTDSSPGEPMQEDGNMSMVDIIDEK